MLLLPSLPPLRVVAPLGEEGSTGLLFSAHPSHPGSFSKGDGNTGSFPHYLGSLCRVLQHTHTCTWMHTCGCAQHVHPRTSCYHVYTHMHKHPQSIHAHAHTHAHTRRTCKHVRRATHEDMHVYACTHLVYTYISMHKHLATQSDKMPALSPSHPTPGKPALRNLAHKVTSMNLLHLTGPGSHLWTQVRRG